MGHQVILAEAFTVGFLVTTAISIGVSLLAGLLLRPKPWQDQYRHQPPNLSSRGSYVGRLQGRMRVGAVIGWVGARFNKKVKQKSGGLSQIFSSSGSDQHEYYESAWHILCIGPAFSLHVIRDGEKVIYDQMVTRDDTPSGSVLSTEVKPYSKFRIYWGEEGQPVDSILAAHLKFTDFGGSDDAALLSRWEGLCFIVWDAKNLGAAPTWPQLDYEITCGVEPAVTGVTPIPDSDVAIARTSSRFRDEGINLVQALWELLLAPWPIGLGMDPAWMHLAEWADAAAIAANERLVVNAYYDGGVQAKDAVASLLKDGTMLLVQRSDKLIPVMLRPVPDDTTLYTIVPDLNVDPEPEEEKQLSTYSPDRVTFDLRDSHLAYRNYTLQERRDWQMRANRRSQEQKVTLSYITDRITGNMVAKRMLPTYGVNAHVMKFVATRDARDLTLCPGTAFHMPNFGQMRITTRQMYGDKSKVEIEAMYDIYSLGFNIEQPILGGGPVTDDPPAAVADLIFVPLYYDRTHFIVPRVRGSNRTGGATVWVSTSSGGTYFQVGTQDAYSTGGPIIASLTGTDTHAEVTTGPTFTALDTDTLDVVADLTGNDPAYDSGQQLMVVGQEVMLVRSLTPTGVSDFITQGITRGQFRSDCVAHSMGDNAVVFARGDQSLQQTTLIAPGVPLWVKCVPHTDAGLEVDIATVTPVELIVPANAWAAITVTEPPAGAVVNGTATVRWVDVDVSGDLDIAYSEDGGATWTDVALSVPNTGLYAWTLAGVPASVDVTVRVRTADGVAQGVSPHPFEVQVGTPWEVAVEGLVNVLLWLRLDDATSTATDASGLGHAGTYAGTGTTQQVTGLVAHDTNKAAQFNGSGHVDVPATGMQLSTSDGSIVVWADFAVAPADGSRFVTVGNGNYFLIEVGVGAHGGELEVILYDNVTNQVVYSGVAASTLAGTKVLLIASYSGGQLYFYINGVQYGPTAAAGLFYASGDANLCVGKECGSGGGLITSVIDEVLIVNSYIDAAAAAALYAAGT